MKVERLYAITVYLLNHGRTPASELAKVFEVSLRTIQRDIDSLCISGIPVIAYAGSNGGYEISETYRLDKHLATSDDYSYILTALKGLVSATNDQSAMNTLEKISQLHKQDDQSIILDFSVLREGEQSTLQALQTAITAKRRVEFTYTNNNNETRCHTVEPVAVIYRWYSWYLLAYSTKKKDYCFFKLVRMSDINVTDKPITAEHETADSIMKKMDSNDDRKYIDITLRVSPAVQTRVKEYLKGTVLEELPKGIVSKKLVDGETIMKMTVVENEHFWFGTLLSLGNEVEVLEPQELRDRLAESAEKILKLYK